MQLTRAILWLVVIILIAGVGVTRFLANGETVPAAAGDFENSSRLAELLGSQRPEGFPLATTPRVFSFPEDHGPHPAYRNEWWYLTGNLDNQDGQRFGYELTIFRFSLAPAPLVESEKARLSAWQTKQVYIAHFAVTDEAENMFYVEQKYSRGAIGLAGAQADPFKVWIDNWSIQEKPGEVKDLQSPESWELIASGDGFGLTLNLTSMKPPVLNGTAGLSRKSPEVGNASYYYSIPRLHSEGSLQIGNITHSVRGLSWLDREWSSSALAADQQGWDWFALQLSDGSDLMFYNIRKTDGGQGQYSAGTFIFADGKSQHLDRDDVVLTVTDQWQSPQGVFYPARWNIELPDFDLRLSVSPVIPNQELITTVRYWEGAVDVAGRHGKVDIMGRGYVELTGYSRSGKGNPEKLK
jgi:predicted secreted hydrolase